MARRVGVVSLVLALGAVLAPVAAHAAGAVPEPVDCVSPAGDPAPRRWAMTAAISPSRTIHLGRPDF